MANLPSCYGPRTRSRSGHCESPRTDVLKCAGPGKARRELSEVVGGTYNSKPKGTVTPVLPIFAISNTTPIITAVDDALTCEISTSRYNRLTTSTLFDTGALQGSYVNRDVGAWVRGYADPLALQRWKKEDAAVYCSSRSKSIDVIVPDGHPCMTVDTLWNLGMPAVLAVNGTAIKTYGTIYADLTSGGSTNVNFAISNVKFTVLDDIPFDVIVGRPTMATHNLFSKLEQHFQTPTLKSK